MTDPLETEDTRIGTRSAVEAHEDTAPQEPPGSEALAGAALQEPPDSDQVVPVWLAVLVLVLLLAVVGMAGYVVRDILAERSVPETPELLEVERWEKAVEQDPSDTDAALNLGYAYQKAGRYEEAIKLYERVIGEKPFDTASRYNMGICLMELKRWDEAEDALWDVLEIDDQHVLAAKALGEYYAAKKQYRSVIAAVRPVVEAQESAADLQYLMGLAYENLGRADWAEARYRLALKYYPDMPEAREGLRRLGIEP